MELKFNYSRSKKIEKKSMFENRSIIKQFLRNDEKILWSQKPYVKKYSLIGSTKLRHTLGILLTLIFGFAFHYFMFSNTVKDPFDWEVIVITMLLSLIFYLFIYLFYLLISADRRKLLNSEYFITNTQIISLSLYKDFINLIKYGTLKIKILVNLPLSNIEYFFYILQKKNSPPKYDVYLKVKFNTLEEWKNTILICKKIKVDTNRGKYTVSIEPDYRWRATALETIERLKDVEDIEKFKAIFIDQLKIKYQDPPEDWKKAFRGGDLHYPY